MVNQVLATEYGNLGSSAPNYHLAELVTIEKLKTSIVEIIECCDLDSRSSCSFCFPSDEEVDDFLLAQEFNLIDIDIKVSLSSLVRKGSRSSAGLVVDYSGLSISHEDNEIDLKQIIENNISSFLSPEDTPLFYIVDNSSLCNGIYEQVFNDLFENLPHLGGVVYIRDKLTDVDELYLKSFGIVNAEIEEANIHSIGELEENSANGVNSFEELIDVLKEAEDSLIINGFNSIEDRIHMIRGIYYGTTWSMDYSQMNSETRNKGFNSYTFSSMPLDPRPYIGDQLFNILFNSPEVIYEGRGIDWGHVVIGLDARRKRISRNMNFFLHESSGLELCTWVGDLGGGAGKLAWERVQNPNKRALSKFSSNSHFGGWINLEGNVGAYLVGRDENVIWDAPKISLSDDDYLADALAAYLSNDNMDWEKRSVLFLNMIGGQSDENIELIAAKIEDFGENYLLARALDGADIDMYEASSHLKGASIEIAKIFVDALVNADSKIKGALDLTPTPKGQPYVKYRLAKKSIELKDKLKEWIKNN